MYNQTYIRSQQSNQIWCNNSRYGGNSIDERGTSASVVGRDVHGIDLDTAVETSHERHRGYEEADGLKSVAAGV